MIRERRARSAGRRLPVTKPRAECPCRLASLRRLMEGRPELVEIRDRFASSPDRLVAATGHYALVACDPDLVARLPRADMTVLALRDLLHLPHRLPQIIIRWPSFVRSPTGAGGARRHARR